MTEFQKVIKGLAMAFAIFLAVTIISSIVMAFTGVTRGISGAFRQGASAGTHLKTEAENMVNIYKDDQIESIKISNSVGKLIVEQGTQFQVTFENAGKNMECYVNGSKTLIVKDKRHGFNWFGNWLSGEEDLSHTIITVQVPEGFTADRLHIDGGVGSVSIDSIAVKSLELDCGAGNLDGRNITAERVDINAGVGNITLSNVNFEGLDLDSGVGEVKIQGLLKGKNDIDAGVGNIRLDLEGSENDYDFKIDPGIGVVRINDRKQGEVKYTNKTAAHYFDIDGGIGNCSIVFSE